MSPDLLRAECLETVRVAAFFAARLCLPRNSFLAAAW